MSQAFLGETSSERMNFRTKPRIKKAIQLAAALLGMDDSVFAMTAAYNAALSTIATHDRTTLALIDHVVFFEALDNPAEPSAALVAAFERYNSGVISR